MLPLGTELNPRSRCQGQDWACCRMGAWHKAPLVHAAHVLTHMTGHILAPQAIPPFEQLLQVISRLHFGFRRCCCCPLGHITFPKRPLRTDETHHMPQADYLETSSAGL